MISSCPLLAPLLGYAPQVLPCPATRYRPRRYAPLFPLAVVSAPVGDSLLLGDIGQSLASGEHAIFLYPAARPHPAPWNAGHRRHHPCCTDAGRLYAPRAPGGAALRLYVFKPDELVVGVPHPCSMSPPSSIATFGLEPGLAARDLRLSSLPWNSALSLPPNAVIPANRHLHRRLRSRRLEDIGIVYLFFILRSPRTPLLLAPIACFPSTFHDRLGLFVVIF
ncbi:hypothetical protein B0H16DRAFT_691670 [Mycena metata]|uniref:Uncharacterized protein n=1 Tax=Mycena metata TaxID=1033252 RepID=A0AAD7M8K8_9AGAR|nr:hypothetical protein B0H16DRAFT_691670 [Mycena metata]